MKNIIGVIESCSSSSISGFVCIPNNAHRPNLDIFIDNIQVGVASYGEQRKLPFAIRSCTCHEFQYVFNQGMAGKRTISVKTVDGKELQNSPYLYCSDSLTNIFKNTTEIKAALSQTFISGKGIEIGALDNPFPATNKTEVKYVDRMNVCELRKQYPELAHKNLVDVDIVTDGESLATIEDDSQNFIIASHFFEHVKNPIKFLLSCARVLNAGGILLLIVPDKRHTFDIDRPLTSIEHIELDYQHGHETQQQQHFNEIVYFQKKLTGEAASKEIERMCNSNYSYHWHVWTSNSFLHCLSSITEKYTKNLETVLFLKGKGECSIVLMKSPL